MSNHPKRRWFRFSLRTLFMLTTLVAIWLAWSLNWISNRRAFVRDSIDAPGLVLRKDRRPVAAPALLWIFGETGAQYVYVATDDEAIVRQAIRLFPEAEVIGPQSDVILPP